MKENINKTSHNDPQPYVPRLLSKKEAAKVLGMCVRNVELAIAKKALSVVRFGMRCVRIRPEDLNRFIESRRVRAIGEITSR